MLSISNCYLMCWNQLVVPRILILILKLCDLIFVVKRQENPKLMAILLSWSSTTIIVYPYMYKVIFTRNVISVTHHYRSLTFEPLWPFNWHYISGPLILLPAERVIRGNSECCNLSMIEFCNDCFWVQSIYSHSTGIPYYVVTSFWFWFSIHFYCTHW